MRVAVINPNRTESMTDGIVSSAHAAAAPDVSIVGWTNTDGPPSIQGEADGDAAVPGVLHLVRKAADAGHAAAVIACFDDTGLEQARAAVPIPVIGIGQAAFLTAMVHGRFSIITTLPVSVPVISGNIDRYGLGSVCAGIHASGLPVLSLESDPDEARARLAECASTAADDGGGALVLGCAGMAPFGPAMQVTSGLPVIDGVAAAIGLARTVVMAASSASKA